MSKRWRIVSFGCAGLLVVAGVAGAVAFGGGTAGQIVAFVLIALGFVLATALVFLEIGLSEDRQRARDAQAAREREERERVGKASSEHVTHAHEEGLGSRRPWQRPGRHRGRPPRLK